MDLSLQVCCIHTVSLRWVFLARVIVGVGAAEGFRSSFVDVDVDVEMESDFAGTVAVSMVGC
jgi:hypothetical protein